MNQEVNDNIDELELAMRDYNPVNCPLTHMFTPGLYTRTVFMPAGTLVTSLIHRTEHQFIVSAGAALVKVNDGSWERIAAPYIGKTLPGTRRVLYIESDCIWTTVHATDIQPIDETDEAISDAVCQIEQAIIEPHENKFLGGVIKNNILSQLIDNQ